MNKQYTDKEVFNERFTNLKQDEAAKQKENRYDDWLKDYEAEIENCKTPIVDLGCGLGNNVCYLLEKGKEVLACDYSEVALETIKKEYPKAKTCLFDMTKKFPIKDNYTNIVIADLSIHYFPDEITQRIIKEIYRILKENGVLLFRINSIDDFNYIHNHEKINDYFIWRSDMRKSMHLFDEESIRTFFKDWKIEKLQKEEMLRYVYGVKMVYNCAVRK